MRHPADELGDAVDHVVGAEFVRFLVIDAHDRHRLVEVEIGLDPRPHRLEGVAVLGAPQRPVLALPGALAHIVADRPAEDAAERVALREMLCLGADDRDEFGFVLHELAGVFRDDDRLAMRNEGVVGAVADIGLFRQFRLAAELFCRLGDVLGIIEAGRIERLRHDRHEEFDVVELVLDPRRLIPGERIAGDLDDLVALDDAVMLAAIGLVSQPPHLFPPSLPCLPQS